MPWSQEGASALSLSTLLAAVRAHLPEEHFAVVDGGLYDNLPAALAQHGIGGRPLFLEAGDAAAVASGPFLVPLDTTRQIETLLALLASGRAPVIWSWARGEAALYRHLRTLNLVDVPVEQDIDDDDEPDQDDRSAPRRRSVVFRHWDPNVLAQVQPLLDPAQKARLLGDAAGLAYLPEASAARDGQMGWLTNDGTAKPPGMLSFSEAQFAALTDTRIQESRRNIMAYLRETAAEDLAEVSDAELYAMVVHAEASGNVIGLRSEHAHGLWAFLHVITGGESSQSREIRQHFYRAAEEPELVLQQVLDAVLAELS